MTKIYLWNNPTKQMKIDKTSNKYTVHVRSLASSDLDYYDALEDFDTLEEAKAFIEKNIKEDIEVDGIPLEYVYTTPKSNKVMTVRPNCVGRAYQNMVG